MRRKDDEKEQRIKEAVVQLILQEGFHGTSISKIAKLANISPATVYIYYESKEDMLNGIYQEYSEEVFSYLLRLIQPQMDGAQVIETLMRGYYAYMTENPEAYSFVEQFSNCPSMANKCPGKKGICHIFRLMSEMKKEHIIKAYSDECLTALIFQPVKALAANYRQDLAMQEKLLDELIQVIQDTLLL